MNKKKTFVGKIASAYQKEGWPGISRRIAMRAQAVKQLGASGLFDRVKGKIVELREGKYSLKYAYPPRFFSDNLADSRPMAEYFAPRLVKALGIKSAIDLGCATGHWVNALEKTGIEVLGIEGGEHAKPMLVCDPNRVMFADLREPLPIEGHYDLVLSIEVAEHIEHRFVHEYIGNMSRFSPKLIMMTAATPGQGGEFHVNEQDEHYWNELFSEIGYSRVPVVEKLIGKFVKEAKNEQNPPEIMLNSLQKHEGVYIPFWMPKNLLVYSRDPAAFNYLKAELAE